MSLGQSVVKSGVRVDAAVTRRGERANELDREVSKKTSKHVA